MTVIQPAAHFNSQPKPVQPRKLQYRPLAQKETPRFGSSSKWVAAFVGLLVAGGAGVAAYIKAQDEKKQRQEDEAAIYKFINTFQQEPQSRKGLVEEVFRKQLSLDLQNRLFDQLLVEIKSLPACSDEKREVIEHTFSTALEDGYFPLAVTVAKLGADDSYLQGSLPQILEDKKPGIDARLLPDLIQGLQADYNVV